MSPGGSTPNSSRNCPELPPLSNIVTTALTFNHGFAFSPPSRLGRPVPPPKQPTFSWRKRIGAYCLTYNTGMTPVPDSVRALERDLREIFGARLQSLVAYGIRASATPHAGDHSHGGGHHVQRPLTHTLAIAE